MRTPSKTNPPEWMQGLPENEERICRWCGEKHRDPFYFYCAKCQHAGKGGSRNAYQLNEETGLTFTRDERLRMGVGSPDSCIIEFPDVFDDMDPQFSLNFFNGGE